MSTIKQARKPSFAASFFAAALSLAVMACPSVATAGEGSFGWIYTLDLQPQGKLEFEQRLSLVRKQANGTYDFWRSRTEIEYGLTNDLQIAAYLNSHSINAANNYTNPDACGGSAPCTSGYGVPKKCRHAVSQKCR